MNRVNASTATPRHTGGRRASSHGNHRPSAIGVCSRVGDLDRKETQARSQQHQKKELTHVELIDFLIYPSTGNRAIERTKSGDKNDAHEQTTLRNDAWQGADASDVPVANDWVLHCVVHAFVAHPDETVARPPPSHVILANELALPVTSSKH